MISKKNKELFTDFALFGAGVGIIGAVNIPNSDNPQSSLASGVSTALPITGTLIGTKLVLDATNKFNKYTKKNKGGLF